MTYTKADTEQAKDELRAILERNHTVYAVVHHVSRSGMQRRIDFYVIEMTSTMWTSPTAPGTNHSTVRRISHLVAKVRGSRLTDEGVVVNSTHRGVAQVDPAWWTVAGAHADVGLGETFGGFEVRYL